MRTPKLPRKLFITAIALAGLGLGTLRFTHSLATAPAPAAIAAKPADPEVSQATDEHPKHPAAVTPAALPAGTVWTLHGGNTAHIYAVAMDELYMPAAQGAKRLHSLPPQPNLAALLTIARGLAAQTGIQPELVLYSLSGPHDESSRRIVTMKVHIETDNLGAVQTAAAALGLTAWQTPGYAPGHAIAQVKGDPAAPLRVAALLTGLPHVSSAAPLLARQRATRTLSSPTDTLFPQQWHLKNTGQQSGVAGMDINVTPVWPTLNGTGVAIGIVDDGLQISHPDLAANVAATGNYDWNGNGVTPDTDPSPDVIQDFHGTAVAGLAAARDNGIGVVGAAPEATLYGLRLIALPETDQDDADAMAWKNDVIQIKNNSWGPADDTPWILGNAGSLWLSAVANGTSTGRSGLGTIYVWAAGNGKDYGDQGTKDAYASNVNVIPVGAATNTGTSAYFSEGGPHLVVCTPGDASLGLVTTDLVGANGYNPDPKLAELADQNYTEEFAGTSASAPIASGVIALMLQANPNLGWRDVKEILLRSSTQIQSTDGDWVTRDGGKPSLPLIKHHPFYGGGLINAQTATALAGTWTNLGTETIVTKSISSAKSIPDAGVAITIPFDLSAASPLRVENVELTVNITHAYRGDLEITLTSPSGVVSTFTSPTFDDDSNDGYPNWTFCSVRHWGETSPGTWTLSIRDAYMGETGRFLSATLKVHGVVLPPPVLTLQPTGFVAAQGTSATLTTAATTTAGTNLSYQWLKDGSAVSGATGASLNFPAITLAQAGAYTCTISNGAGKVTTDAAKVIVYTGSDQSQIVNTGANFTTPLIATGPIDSFQWSLNGTPLANSSHITGATTGALTVNKVTTADNGTYTLAAMVNGNPLPTGTISFSVRTPPDVSAPASFTTRLGSTLALPLAIGSGTYIYTYTGLPKGLTYSETTGAISGRTTATGTFFVTLTVRDIFGLVTTLNITLTVSPLPSSLVGAFNGYVARDPGIDGNLGGTLAFTTSSSGALTGKLTLGSTAYAFKGNLDGASGAHATASISIPRKGASPLLLQLDIPLDDSAVTGTLNSSVATTAWRNPWSKTSPATAYAGHYTFALETPSGAGWPAGYSTGTLAVTTTGAASWTLQPADGAAALKGTTTLSADGTLPLFAKGKTPAGSFLGFLTLPPVSTPSVSMGGSVSWLREATSSALYANAAGFGPLSMTVHGGLYTSPASDGLLLGLPSTTNNAELEFGGNDVDLGAQTGDLSAFIFTLASQNKMVTPSVNPTALKLTVNASTGQFSGTFSLTDPSIANPGATVKRSDKFTGVFLLQEGLGAGAFVLPEIPSSGNGTRSGSVIFTEPTP